MTGQPDNPADTPLSELPRDGLQLFSVGATLRAGRMRLGLSVAEVSNRIKFAPRQIEALEADDFTRLPEMAFVRGFVRSYARALQLDPTSLLAALPRPPAQQEPVVEAAMAEVPYSSSYLTNKSNLVWLGAALVIVILLGVFVWLLNGPSAPAARPQLKVEPLALPALSPVPAVADRAASSAVTSPPAPAPVTSALPPAGTTIQRGSATAGVAAVPVVAAPAPVAAVVKPALPPAATTTPAAATLPTAAGAESGPADTIRLVFDEESWVEVRDKYGKVLLSQVFSPGSEQSLDGRAPFAVVVGHASGVHLFYKGQAVDLKPHTKISVARLTLE